MENVNASLDGQNMPVKEMGFLRRAAGIVTSPVRTMEELAKRPRILFPLLASLLSVSVFYLLRFSLYEDFLTKMMEITLADKNMQLTPEQLQASINMGRILGVATAPLSGAFYWLAGAAVILGICRVFKGEGSFRQYLSVTGYAYVIMILYYIISFAVSFFSGELMLDASLANITNLFAPDIKGTFIYGIVRGIDLFGIWYYAVMAEGVCSVSRLSKVKSYTIVYAVYFIMILLGSGSYKYM